MLRDRRDDPLPCSQTTSMTSSLRPCHVAGAEVVPPAVHEGAVEHRLMSDVRLRLTEVEHRGAEALQRANDLLAVLDRTRHSSTRSPRTELAMKLGWNEIEVPEPAAGRRSSSARRGPPRSSRGRSATPQAPSPSARRSVRLRTVGPTGWSRNSNSVTIPKLPPPPRRPQKRSAFSSSLAVTSSPPAVTRSTDDQAGRSSAHTCDAAIRSRRRGSGPATPVWVTIPPVVASPNAWVSRSSSPQRTPAWTRAVCAPGSTRIPFIGAEVDDDAAVADRHGPESCGHRP